MASAFDLSALTTYVKENQDVLISTLVTGSKTIQIIQSEGNVQTGIKTNEKISVLDVDTTWQEGDGCGFTPNGGTDISQRVITVGNIKIDLEWCLEDLIPYYTQELMRQGVMAEREELPGKLESAILDRLTAKQNRDMEIAVWRGDTASGNDKLQHFDGFIKLLDGAGTAIYSNDTTGTGTIASNTGSATVTGTGTAFTTQGIAAGDKIYRGGTFIGTVSSVGSQTSITLTGNAAATANGTFSFVTAADAGATTTGNIISRVDALYGAIPEAVLNSEGARLWIGADEARTYLRALTSANLFNYTAEGNMLRDGFVLPGTDLRVTPTPGLSGTGRRYVINPENMWFGTDLENEWERFKLWYNEEDEMLCLKARWRAGVQIGFPEEVTSTF